MRILFLAPQPFYEVRGTPLAVDALVRTLASLGHSIDLLTFPQGASWAPPQHVRHLRSLALAGSRVKPGFSFGKMLQDVPFALRAIALARSGSYDVVHAVEESALLVAPFVPRGVRFVVDMDSDMGEQLRLSRSFLPRVLAPFAHSLHSQALRRADLAVVINKKLADSALSSRGELPICQLADPPLVSSLTSEDRDRAQAIRRELAIDDTPVALYTGNFEPYQGVDLMYEALGATKNVVFVFVGGQESEIAAMKASQGNAHTRSRSRFVGTKPPAEIGTWLALADVLVSPRREGGNTPFKIYTYMASGKPIVATRLDTHTQVLTDESATLVDPTPRGIAEGIDGVLRDREEANQKALRAQSILDAEYSVAQYRARVETAYAKLAARRP